MAEYENFKSEIRCAFDCVKKENELSDCEALIDDMLNEQTELGGVFKEINYELIFKSRSGKPKQKQQQQQQQQHQVGGTAWENMLLRWNTSLYNTWWRTRSKCRNANVIELWQSGIVRYYQYKIHCIMNEMESCYVEYTSDNFDQRSECTSTTLFAKTSANSTITASTACEAYNVNQNKSDNTTNKKCSKTMKRTNIKDMESFFATVENQHENNYTPINLALESILEEVHKTSMSNVFYSNAFMALIEKFDRLLTSYKGVKYFAKTQSSKLNIEKFAQIHFPDRADELANSFTSNYYLKRLFAVLQGLLLCYQHKFVANLTNAGNHITSPSGEKKRIVHALKSILNFIKGALISRYEEVNLKMWEEVKLLLLWCVRTACERAFPPAQLTRLLYLAQLEVLHLCEQLHEHNHHRCENNVNENAKVDDKVKINTNQSNNTEDDKNNKVCLKSGSGEELNGSAKTNSYNLENNALHNEQQSESCMEHTDKMSTLPSCHSIKYFQELKHFFFVLAPNYIQEMTSLLEPFIDSPDVLKAVMHKCIYCFDLTHSLQWVLRRVGPDECNAEKDLHSCNEQMLIGTAHETHKSETQLATQALQYEEEEPKHLHRNHKEGYYEREIVKKIDNLEYVKLTFVNVDNVYKTIGQEQMQSLLSVGTRPIKTNTASILQPITAVNKSTAMDNINDTNTISTSVDLLLVEEKEVAKVFLYNVLRVLFYPLIHNTLSTNADEYNINVCNNKQLQTCLQSATVLTNPSMQSNKCEHGQEDKSSTSDGKQTKSDCPNDELTHKEVTLQSTERYFEKVMQCALDIEQDDINLSSVKQLLDIGNVQTKNFAVGGIAVWKVLSDLITQTLIEKTDKIVHSNEQNNVQRDVKLFEYLLSCELAFTSVTTMSTSVTTSKEQNSVNVGTTHCDEKSKYVNIDVNHNSTYININSCSNLNKLYSLPKECASVEVNAYTLKLITKCSELFNIATQVVLHRIDAKYWTQWWSSVLVGNIHGYLLSCEDDNFAITKMSTSTTTTCAKAANEGTKRILSTTEKLLVSTVNNWNENQLILNDEAKVASAFRLISILPQESLEKFLAEYDKQLRRRLLYRPVPFRVNDAKCDKLKQMCENNALAMMPEVVRQEVKYLELLKVVHEYKPFTFTIPTQVNRPNDDKETKDSDKDESITLCVNVLEHTKWSDWYISTLLGQPWQSQEVMMNREQQEAKQEKHEEEEKEKREESDHTSHVPVNVTDENEIQAHDDTENPQTSTMEKYNCSNGSTLPFPAGWAMLMQRANEYYETKHPSRRLVWYTHAERGCYSIFTIAYPRDAGKLTTIQARMQLHRYFELISQSGRRGICYATLARCTPGTSVASVIHELKLCIKRDKLLVEIDEDDSIDSSRNNGKEDENSNNSGNDKINTNKENTNVSKKKKKENKGNKRVALNYNYTTPAAHVNRPRPYIYWQKPVTQFSKLKHESYEQCNKMEQKYLEQIQMSIMKIVKQRSQIAHDTLHDSVKKQLSKLDYVINPAMFKKATESLLEKGCLQRVMSSDNKEQCYKYLDEEKNTEYWEM